VPRVVGSPHEVELDVAGSARRVGSHPRRRGDRSDPHLIGRRRRKGRVNGHRRPQAVNVVIAGTNDALEEQTDGGIAGEGTFRAAGAITDKGPVTAYRGVNEGLILLRYVTKGRKGAITYLVKIDTTRRPVISRWTIESGTRSYKGLQGKGIESENATFTVSTLRGKVWR
jgi:hypothetical protein